LDRRVFLYDTYRRALETVPWSRETDSAIEKNHSQIGAPMRDSNIAHARGDLVPPQIAFVIRARVMPNDDANPRIMDD